MNADRFSAVADRYEKLRIVVAGDFFLDRYLEIDPAREETSIETGLPVHNVVRVRALPGAAGTIVNNLVALGVGEIHCVGFCGDDGEGYELRRSLVAQPGVSIDHFLMTNQRSTPVYCKPLLCHEGTPLRELSRFDSKNWTPTPEELQARLVENIHKLADRVDAIILMDQVDRAETGVVTGRVASAAHALLGKKQSLLVLADSRRGLHDYPPLAFKMNAVELDRMTRIVSTNTDSVMRQAAGLAERNGLPVFVTLAEQGIVGALPGRAPEHVEALAVRGPIDIVGAGDSVTANLAAALAGGAAAREAMSIAMAAASVVIHQLGTTGTASVAQIAERLYA
jgi:rfaE bifunctional protein kinase chain/domain